MRAKHALVQKRRSSPPIHSREVVLYHQRSFFARQKHITIDPRTPPPPLYTHERNPEMSRGGGEREFYVVVSSRDFLRPHFRYHRTPIAIPKKVQETCSWHTRCFPVSFRVGEVIRKFVVSSAVGCGRLVSRALLNPKPAQQRPLLQWIDYPSAVSFPIETQHARLSDYCVSDTHTEPGE